AAHSHMRVYGFDAWSPGRLHEGLALQDGRRRWPQSSEGHGRLFDRRVVLVKEFVSRAFFLSSFIRFLTLAHLYGHENGKKHDHVCQRNADVHKMYHSVVTLVRI